MAAPTRILSLSLGTQTIGLAEFKTGQNGGLVLASYETRELLADPAAERAGRFHRRRKPILRPRRAW